ncbi:MAG TPA: radical SAM protein [Pseudolabrys sp.]|nr:radical SAM protein [Pseudolabrys sp.]
MAAATDSGQCCDLPRPANSGVEIPLAAGKPRPIMLIGFQRMANLGIGYLAATLRREGYPVEVVDYERHPTEILALAKKLNPIAIGFSLIFQFYIRRFGDLIDYLRANGIDCHFTMGGHYPTLSYRQTLATVPGLDSVVRFEGELTLLELVRALHAEVDWRAIDGLCFMRDGEAVANAPRKLIPDLDSLPYPQRDFEPHKVLGRAAFPLLASRGCARTCSFCSIHTFYRTAPGKVVRTRQPADVVREMTTLNAERGISIFLFQDDDFPLFGKVWRAWANEFVDELHRAGLPGRAIWKINCRADAVEPDLMARMRDAGLYMVYMGLESGTEQGLKVLHKEITVAENLRAVRILKRLGIMFEFGFMLLDPSSDFQSILGNIDFLRAIVGDGSAGAVFCKMLPYDGTPIKDELERGGRLRGDVSDPDYDFLDPRVDEFYRALRQTMDVSGWVHGYKALSPQLNWACNEAAIMQHLFPDLPGLGRYKGRLRKIIRESNALLFRTVEELVARHSGGAGQPPDNAMLKQAGEAFLARLLDERNGFVLRNQDLMLQALQEAQRAA